MRCAVYARVSTERQERQQTIDSQLAALNAWALAADHSLEMRHVFRDEGYSGARLDRPGLHALRDAVRDGEIDIVAVLSPDRLARKYAYQALVLEEFRRAGCEVAFLNHSISDNPGDQLLLQIQGAVAEYERALLGERFRRGKLQKARAGWFIGGRAPYGYRYVPAHEGAGGRLEIDDAEAAVVRVVYGWLVDEQMTIRQILKRLNFGPWFPRSGRHPWSPSVVHHILSEPVYAGTSYVNRYDFVEAKRPRSRKPSYSGKGCRRMRELCGRLGDALGVRAAYRGGCRACQNLSSRAIRHGHSYQRRAVASARGDRRSADRGAARRCSPPARPGRRAGG